MKESPGMFLDETEAEKNDQVSLLLVNLSMEKDVWSSDVVLNHQNREVSFHLEA